MNGTKSRLKRGRTQLDSLHPAKTSYVPVSTSHPAKTSYVPVSTSRPRFDFPRRDDCMRLPHHPPPPGRK